MGITIIVVTNIVQILIIRRRWKTLPLLLFYIFAFLVTFERTLYSLILFTTEYNKWLFFLTVSGPTAKLAIGLIQLWIVTELSLRLKVGI